MAYRDSHEITVNYLLAKNNKNVWVKTMFIILHRLVTAVILKPKILCFSTSALGHILGQVSKKIMYVYWTFFRKCLYFNAFKHAKSNTEIFILDLKLLPLCML
jgi:hypothetical protein